MKQIYSPFLLNKEASLTSDFTLTFHFSRKALITNKVQKYQFLLVYAIEKQQWILSKLIFYKKRQFAPLLYNDSAPDNSITVIKASGLPWCHAHNGRIKTDNKISIRQHLHLRFNIQSFITITDGHFRL